MPSSNNFNQFRYVLRNSFRLKHNQPKYYYSNKPDSNRSTPNNEPNKRQLNKLNIFGTLGITSALIASYLIVKNAQDQQLNSCDCFDPGANTTIISDTKLLPNTPIETTNINIPDEKDEGLRDKYNFIKKIVTECADAVFYLELRDPFLKDPETKQSLITSNGSGFIISEDGWALTNAHVVLNKPQTTITAIMRNGKSYNAKIEDADMNIDLALLKLETNEKLPCLQFGKTGDTAVGEWVIALGSPLSLSNSVTVGIVSSADRPAEELGLKNYAMRYIQTDASITFGNSGGPLVNLDGNVIGINNLRLTSGISFAIPVEYIRKFLKNTKYRMENLSNSIKLNRTLFGLTTISISPELIDDLKKEIIEMPKDITQGLLVWKIIQDTPADKSGLEVGDIITHINGIPIKKPIDLYNYLSNRNSLDISVINKGKRKKLLLNLDA